MLKELGQRFLVLVAGNDPTPGMIKVNQNVCYNIVRAELRSIAGGRAVHREIPSPDVRAVIARRRETLSHESVPANIELILS